LFPEGHELEDFIILLVLAQLPVGIAEDTAIGILCQESQDTFLASAALGNIVFFQESILAVKGDDVEVEIERSAAFQLQFGQGIEPARHQRQVSTGVDAATVFGEEGAFGNDVQAGEQGQAFVEHGTHHVTVACRAEQLQGQQGPHRLSGGDHLGAGEIGLAQDLVEGNLREERQEQEQTTALGTEVSRGPIEFADIGDIGGGRLGTCWSLLIGSAGQPGEALLFEKLGDGDGAVNHTFPCECPADVIDGKVLFA
jgi:hypothetical protein